MQLTTTDLRGNNEKLHLFAGEESEKVDEISESFDLKQSSPLKDLAYYENRKFEQLNSTGGIANQGITRKENKSMLYLSHTKIKLNKRDIRLSDDDYISPIYSGKLLVLKEKVNQMLRVFHICENSDINTLIGIEKIEKEKMRKLYNFSPEKGNLTIREEAQEEGEDSKEGINYRNNYDSKSDSSFNSSKEKIIEMKSTEKLTNLDTNLDTHQDIHRSNPYYRLSSVMNFSHTLNNNSADRETSELMLDLDQLEK